MILVTLSQALENIDGLVHSGRVYDHRLEPPFERSILLDVLAVLIQRRRAHALEFAPGQRRLEHVGGVDRALGGARTDQGVQLVDEEHDVLVLGDLVHHCLEALFELPAILRAGDHRRHVQGQYSVTLE